MNLPRLELVSQEFNPNIFGTPSDVRQSLGNGDNSVAIVVTCSELGFEPDLLSGAATGDLTVVQTVGGLVLPPYQLPEDQDIFCNKFADPAIRHIILCGHSECKIFDRLLNDLDGHKELLMYRFAKPTLLRLNSVYQDRPSSEFCQIMIQESLLQQADLIQKRPDVARRLADGSLQFHIWIRDDQTARIATYDAFQGQFHLC